MSTTPLDLSNIWGTPNQNQSGSNTPQQSGALDLSGIWGGSPMATIPGQSPLPSLQTGHDESDRFDTEDPNDNWLEKGWHFLNKPLTETLFGWGEYRHGAGGLERGTEKVLSGLTSPLSLGLLAAFAPAGIAEGVGGTVLKEGLMEGGTALGEGALDEVAAASKIEQYAKAVQAAKKAQVSGNSIKEAVSAATNSEMPYQEFLNYGQYLKSNGLQETDMLGESFARRSASRGLKMAGFTPAKAMNIAKGAETLVNMGFAYQQVKGAVYAVPRIADLMSHGDYDDAAEYMVEGAVGGVFGGLAFAHGLHSVNDLIKVDEANQLPLSDEAELMKSIGNTMDLEYQKDNINISERKRQRMSEFLDLIGMPVPAKYQLGTWSEVGPTKEFSSALSEIFTTKSKREHLEQKQLEFFHRMDLGNSPLAAHQLRNALIQGYKLEDKVPNYHPPDIPMTVDDIAKGEISNRAFDMARLRGVSQKVSSLDSELSGFANALKEAEPEEQEQLKQLISAKTQERNTLSLEQSRLQGITDEAKDWERMNEEFVPKPEGYASEDEENAAKQDFYKQREERNLGLVRNYYNKLNDEVKEALRTKVVGDKFDPNKIDDARIIANNIRDMKVIEQAYPEFSQTENGEQSSDVEASRTDEPFESGEGSGKPTDRSVQSGREETISGNPEASGISRTIDYLKKQLDSFLAKGGDKSNPEVQRTEVRLGFLKKKLDQIVSKLGLRPDSPEGGTPPQQPPVPPSEAQEPPTPSEPELPGKNWRPVLPPELYQPPEWRQHLEGWMSEHFPIHPWMDSAQHPLLPHNINELVQKARAKNWNKDQIDEIMRHVNALERIETTPLTEKEKGFYDNMVKDEQGNWTTGYMHGIINSIVDNHIHHIWGEDDDIGNHLKQLGASGSFSINATQARHRSFATAAEGLLMGKKLKVSDPIALAAHDANNVAQAAAHRKFLETLRNGVIAKDGSHMKVYDPEGMPAVVMFGRGYEVPGVDGDSSSILVNPNRVRNIEMEPWEIQRLQKAGLLDTYLKDGRVVDKTPEATIDNVKDWIQKTNKQIGSLEEKNPLLAGGKESLDRHKEAWKQLQVIAKQQAEKISDYLDKALHKIVYEQGTDGSGYYKGVSIDEKPNDISLAKSIDKKLHGGTISPKDLQRLQDYADRNRMYADGLSSFDSGESELRPSEISRLIRQESDFLPPELKKYLFDVHDLLNWNEKKGENGKEYEWPLREDDTWTRKGLNKSIKYIAHAAENKVYPQLIKDLSDLKYVDNVLHPDPVTGYVPWKESDTPKIINPVTMEEHRPEAEARLKDINERQEKKYLWAPKSHISIDHHAFRKYNWMASAPDGTPTLAESDMGVSKYFYKYMVNRMGLEPSWVRQNPVTNKILKTTQGAKNLLLSFSPFHIVQEALRGAMLGINPFYRPNPLERLDETRMTARGPLKIDELGVKNNLTTFSDRHMAEDHSVGVSSHGGIVSKIPVYGRIADQIHDFLFNRYIPDLKVRGFRRMFDKYAESHPDWTNDAVARAAADHVNSAFGGINWRALGRSATTQDWFHIFALAPDWLESEVRFMTSVFQNSGIGPAKYQPESGKNIARQQVITAAVALWTSARVLNLLSTGKAHFEAPFGVAHKDKDGKETIYSVRTLPTDILHAASDPTGFLVGRESPFVRTSLEAYTGRNQYGQKLTPGERYVDMISNLSPIWGQSVLKQVTNLSTSSDVGFGSQIAKSAGATAQVYRTPAQKEAADLAAERSEEGAMNPQMISRHRLLLQLEDDMRGGRINVTDLTHMVNQGAIPEADAKEIVKTVRETAGQDPEEARLYSRVSRMDWQGSIAVWDVANPSEKQMLERVIIKKAKSYLSKARKNFTPNEIMKDPLFKRAQQMAPMIQPETE